MKRNNKKENKNKSNEIELKHSRIELWISAVSLFLSIVSLIMSIFLTKSQIDLEYNQSLPNLSMSVELTTDDDGEERLNCQIKNDGGNIREAVITPHLYLKYTSMPILGAKSEKSFAIEIKDLFAPYFGNGIYYSSDVPYNPDENSWFLEVEKLRMRDAYELLFRVAEPFAEGPIMAGFDFCLEVRYVDLMGRERIEWYNATNGFDTDMLIGESKSSPSFQLQRIDNDSLITYTEAFGVQIGDDLSIDLNEETMSLVSELVYQELFG